MPPTMYFNRDALSHGEQITLSHLEKLPDDWVVIANKILLTPPRDREIDFIVIGNGVIFNLDDKAWSGPIHGTEVQWVLNNGAGKESPIDNSARVSRQLRGYLDQKVPQMKSNRETLVLGGVTLSKQTEMPNVQDPRLNSSVYILEQDHPNYVIDKLIDTDNQFAKATGSFVKTQKENITKSLYDLSRAPEIPTVIDAYSIIEKIESPYSEMTVFLGRHESGPERRLTRYKLGFDSEREKEYYLQEFNALDHLSGTGITTKVQPWFYWGDNEYIVIPTDIPEGSNYGSLKKPASLEELCEELMRARSIFRAISQVHSKGIIHRNLNYGSVYLQEHENDYTSTITGFWRSRIKYEEPATIAPFLDNKFEDRDLQIEPLIAPEIFSGHELSDETSDTYSVGMMLLFRLTELPASDIRTPEGVLNNSVLDSLFSKLCSYTGQTQAKQLSDLLGEILHEDPVSLNANSKRLSASDCDEYLTLLLDSMIPKCEPPILDMEKSDCDRLSDLPLEKQDVGIGTADGTPDESQISSESSDDSQGISNQSVSDNHKYYTDSGRPQCPMTGTACTYNCGTELSCPGPALPQAYESAYKSSQKIYTLVHNDNQIVLTKDLYTVGRAPNNDLSISNDQAISRNHLSICIQDGQCILKDLNTTNGTTVNGEEISECTVTAACIITIGSTSLEIVCKESPITTPATCTITILSDASDESVFPIATGNTSIGRADENDVVLHDTSVSKFHCQLNLTDYLSIKDNQSTNGTFIGSFRVTDAILNDGDILKLGQTYIRVNIASDRIT